MKYEGPFSAAENFRDNMAASLVFDSAVRELLTRSKEIESFLETASQEEMDAIGPEVLKELAQVETLWNKATAMHFGNA